MQSHFRFKVGLALRWVVISGLVATLLSLSLVPIALGQGDGLLTIVGTILDQSGEAISGATVEAILSGEGDSTPLGRSESQTDGTFVLEGGLSPETIDSVIQGEVELTLRLSGPHYRTLVVEVSRDEMARNGVHLFADVGELTLEHRITPAFVIATLTFLLALILMSVRVLHGTVASLLGAVVLLGISYLVGSYNPDFFILSFETAITSIDFNVIFLVLGMMIVVAILGETGIFQWLAFRAHRLTEGNAWHLAVLLTLITGLASAFFNSVTVMLLLVPVTVEVALVLRINPLSLVIPEVMASNIGGTATLIGNPPNTIIGSYAGLGFADFLFHMGPVALLNMLVLLTMMRWIYGREYRRAGAQASSALLKQLEENSKIRDPVLLRQGVAVFLLTIVLFFTGDLFHMPPSVAALMGATALLVWVRPDVHRLLQEVDWTVLVFFIGLFIMVGGLQQVGLIAVLADLISHLAGGNLIVATALVLFTSGLASGVVENIPLAAAILPIVAFLTRTIPGTGNNILFWALSAGSCLGGNATYIGSAPNLVAVGMLERAGYPVSFWDFMKVGTVIMLATLVVSLVWILVRYGVL